MNTTSPLPLKIVCVATVLFGATMMLAPAITRAGFGWLMFGDSSRIAQWPAQAQAYVTLVHGVLGAVMVGWAVALLGLLTVCWLTNARATWRAVAVSVLCWFVPDTLFSISQGAWPNVALNAVFAAAFGLALLSTRSAITQR
jgi:hypothetical protein